MKKIRLTVLTVLFALCISMNAFTFISVNTAHADPVLNEPTFSDTTKVMLSTDNGRLLLVTAIKDIDDVYEIGYEFTDGSPSYISNGTDTYFSSLSDGVTVVTPEDLFGGDFATGKFIVWEINYSIGDSYTFRAYAKVGYRDGGGVLHETEPEETIDYGTSCTRQYISLANESDLNGKFLKDSDESYVLTSDIYCETGTSITYSAPTFNGILYGNGHIIKNPVIDDDITSYGILGHAINGGKVKDIAVVNATNSYRNYFSYDGYSGIIENSYFSGTCAYHDLFEYVYGWVTLKNVILDCYCGADGYALGKAGGGSVYSDRVHYDNVITLDKNGKGAHSDSEYGGTLMTYDYFFNTYAAGGLPAAWENSGFTVDAQGLKFHGTLVLAKPVA
ncbi:MAG: hypothetical protein J5697_00425 [Clostridia bacterium]|nr:hypothetical protein [Clostridia bacterium]